MQSTQHTRTGHLQPSSGSVQPVEHLRATVAPGHADRLRIPFARSQTYHSVVKANVEQPRRGLPRICPLLGNRASAKSPGASNGTDARIGSHLPTNTLDPTRSQRPGGTAPLHSAGRPPPIRPAHTGIARNKLTSNSGRASAERNRRNPTLQRSARRRHAPRWRA